MSDLLELPKLCPLADIKVNLVMGPAQSKRLAQAVAYLKRAPGPLGVDTETTGLDPHQNRVRLIQVGTEEMALVVDLDGFRGADGARQIPDFLEGAEGPLADLAELLRSSRPKVLQNAAFDLNFLRAEGVLLGGPLFDTMFASKVFNMGTGAPNNLGAIVERTLGEAMPKELQKADWSGELDGDMVDYAARDACALPRLVAPLRKKLKGARVSGSVSLYDVFKLEMSCLRAFASMQWWGFGFDAQAAEELKVRLVATEREQKLAFLQQLDTAIRAEHPEDEAKWLPREPDGSFNTREKTKGSIRLGTKVYAGFNPRSNKQMAERFEDAGVLLPPGEKGAPSLDQNLLAFIEAEEPLVAAYLGWKEAATRVSGVESLLASQGPDGRIHAGYRQMGTDTGRCSCAGPNLQQVPKIADFRRLFVAEPGYSLVVADFSQVELRVAAELSGEPRMRAAYKAGRDLHTETAALMLDKPLTEVTKDERQSAKVANFGLLYGAGAATLQKQAISQYGLVLTFAESKAIVEAFRKAYPTLLQWQRDTGEQTCAAVYTRYGRRRMLTGFNDKFTTRLNTPVQGTAGDICKIAISMLWRRIRARSHEVRLLAQVHDELVLEVLNERVEHWSLILKSDMEEAGNLVCRSVPIIAEVSSGTTWADAK
jgi:DNA polymerase I